MTEPESITGFEFGADDWTPTPHGEFLAENILEHDLVVGKNVLELGAGIGNHTLLLLEKNAASIVATEITEERLRTTRTNVSARFPDAPIEFRVADWLDTHGTFDVVVANPPFCKSGKQNRRYFIDSLILDGHKRLAPGGRLMFVQSSMADVAKTQRRLEENGYSWRILGEKQGPFRDYYFEDETFMEEMKSVRGGFEIVDGVHQETLYVIAAELQPFAPPSGAH